MPSRIRVRREASKDCDLRGEAVLDGLEPVTYAGRPMPGGRSRYDKDDAREQTAGVRVDGDGALAEKPDCRRSRASSANCGSLVANPFAYAFRRGPPDERLGVFQRAVIRK